MSRRFGVLLWSNMRPLALRSRVLWPGRTSAELFLDLLNGLEGSDVKSFGIGHEID